MTSEPNAPGTAGRAALLDRVQRSWDELLATVEGLDERQVTAPSSDRWSVKDHLAHLTRWEEHLLAVLDGRDGRAELGLEDGQDGDTDAVNDALQRLDAGRSPEEVRRRLGETHARVVARLEDLGPADLEQWRAKIDGDTHEHYAEHAAWIRALTPGLA